MFNKIIQSPHLNIFSQNDVIAMETLTDQIAVALEKMEPSRPLTHDLLKNIFDTAEIDLSQIIINNLKDQYSARTKLKPWDN